MNQRALQRFVSTIHSDQTRKNYKRHLDYFMKFFGITNYDSILSIPTNKAQEMDGLQNTFKKYVLIPKQNEI